jgi:hypothetical protein
LKEFKKREGYYLNKVKFKVTTKEIGVETEFKKRRRAHQRRKRRQ